MIHINGIKKIQGMYKGRKTRESLKKKHGVERLLQSTRGSYYGDPAHAVLGNPDLLKLILQKEDTMGLKMYGGSKEMDIIQKYYKRFERNKRYK